ncbi:MAG: iron complex outermembrane receptor protein [Saprospiraceae bacterium]|jgi:iron complex outermembrane receptor protein
MKRLYTSLILILAALPMMVNAQSISGTVTDAGGAIIGATISAGSMGTVTDVDGTYTLTLKSAGDYTIDISYIGYATQSKDFTLAADEKATWDVVLEDDATMLEELIIVGSRTAPRSSTTSPLPVDVFSATELTSTGQNSFDKALQYRVPSFNTVQTPVNDATSLLDPYEIRNMGPSRTLILINGKRKNMSALLYTQTSPGRGETGADISAIPTDAIKRVEILRDGASAQYGSDAIAGVMNIIMKDSYDEGSITLRAGMTGEGDGETVGVSMNNGSKLGKDGFINYTIDLSKRELANRPSNANAAGEAADFIGGATTVEEANAQIATVNEFLSKYPDANNVNGSPETTAAKFAVNFGTQISESTEMYGNAAYVYKKVNSFANYRVPYWRTVEAFPYLADFFPNGDNGEYIGYVPTFDGDLNDYNGTIGFRNKTNGWITDASFTTGGNQQTYLVRNSHNRNGTLNPDSTFTYRENSPLIFDVGGTRFTHNVGNIDVTKRINDMFGFAFGSEFRSETFTIIPGSVASYEDGGPDSFAGNDPRNSGKFNRYNFGGYADVALDLTDDFLINATARVENYSDFGNAFVWKVSSRYKFAEDKVTVRGSVSTGFKAPALHQIYTQKAQYSFIPGQGIQVGGLVNNVSREARLLDLPSLEPEKSTNITIGVGVRPSNNFSFTIDYYNIAVTDRIILSTEISKVDKDPADLTEGEARLNDLLDENNLSDLSFFVNALDTRTSGIDFVSSYRNIELGAGKMGINLSGNYMIQNEQEEGSIVNNPTIVEEAGQSVVNDTQRALFFTSRPKFKAILGIDYKVGKFGVSLNNTLFGPTTFQQQGMDENIFTEFKSAVVTDLALNYQISEKVGIALNVNNILNVLPEWEFKAHNEDGQRLLDDTSTNLYGVTPTENQLNLISFNQRYAQMTYDGYHFSQLGTMVNFSMNVKF